MGFFVVIIGKCEFMENLTEENGNVFGVFIHFN